MTIRSNHRGNRKSGTLAGLGGVGVLVVFAGCKPSSTNAEMPDRNQPAATAPLSSPSPSSPSSSNDSPKSVLPKSLTATSKLSKLNMQYNELTEKEAAVLIGKGTERAYTGEFTDNKRKGTYICRRCNGGIL